MVWVALSSVLGFGFVFGVLGVCPSLRIFFSHDICSQYRVHSQGPFSLSVSLSQVIGTAVSAIKNVNNTEVDRPNKRQQGGARFPVSGKSKWVASGNELPHHYSVFSVHSKEFATEQHQNHITLIALPFVPHCVFFN